MLGVERMARAGFQHARPAIIFGGQRDFLQAAWPDVPRDVCPHYPYEFGFFRVEWERSPSGYCTTLASGEKASFSTELLTL